MHASLVPKAQFELNYSRRFSEHLYSCPPWLHFIHQGIILKKARPKLNKRFFPCMVQTTSSRNILTISEYKAVPTTDNNLTHSIISTARSHFVSCRVDGVVQEYQKHKLCLRPKPLRTVLTVSLEVPEENNI